MSDSDHDGKGKRKAQPAPVRRPEASPKPRPAPPKPAGKSGGRPLSPKLAQAAKLAKPPNPLAGAKSQTQRKAAGMAKPPHPLAGAVSPTQAKANKMLAARNAAQPKPATPKAQAAGQKLASTPAATVPKAAQSSFAAIQKALGPNNRYSGFLAKQLQSGQLSAKDAARLAQVAQQARGKPGQSVVRALYTAQNKLDSAHTRSDVAGIYGKALLDSGKQLPGAAWNFVKGAGNGLLDTGKGLWGLGKGVVSTGLGATRTALGAVAHPVAAWNDLRAKGGQALKGAQAMAKFGGGVVNDLRHQDDPKARARLAALKTGTINSLKQGAGNVWNAVTAGYQAEIKKGNYAGAVGRGFADAGTMLFTGGFGAAAKAGSVAKVVNVLGKLPGGAAALKAGGALTQTAKLKGLQAVGAAKGAIGKVGQATKARVAQGVFKSRTAAQGTAKWAAEHASAGVKYGQASAGHALTPGHAVAGIPGRWKGPSPKWADFKPKTGLGDHIHQMRARGLNGKSQSGGSAHAPPTTARNPGSTLQERGYHPQPGERSAAQASAHRRVTRAAREADFRKFEAQKRAELSSQPLSKRELQSLIREQRARGQLRGQDIHRFRYHRDAPTGRMAEIDQRAGANYQRVLEKMLDAKPHHYRYTTRKTVDSFYRDPNTPGIRRPTYMTDTKFTTNRASMDRAQVAEAWGVHDVGIRIPKGALVDPTVPRPFGNSSHAKLGWEFSTHAYPEYGSGHSLQFLAKTNKFDDSWVFDLADDYARKHGR